jgi:hypothetical protein
MKKSGLVLAASLAVIVGAIAPVSKAALLAVDVNDRQPTAADTQPGFSPFILADTTTISAAVTTSTTRTIGTYSVTLAPFDDHLDENTVTAGVQDGVGALDDRPRPTPVNGGSLTYAQIYNDLVFAGTTNGPSGGMDLKVSGGDLLPNTQYLVSIYAFDQGSTAAPQPRSANWLDGNNADALVAATSFAGAALPTTDFQYRFNGLAMTDASGMLFLKGRNTTPNSASGATNIGVFLNAFEVNVAPEPGCLPLLSLAALAPKRRRR